MCSWCSRAGHSQGSKVLKMHLHALKVYSDFDKLGQKIVIIGGGLIGCETGYLLADLGKNGTYC